jgi:hypothetical protein
MIQKDRQRKKKNGGQKQDDIINRHGKLKRKIEKQKGIHRQRGGNDADRQTEIGEECEIESKMKLQLDTEKNTEIPRNRKWHTQRT